MLLEIIDLYDDRDSDYRIGLKFTSDPETIEFESDYLSSPFTQNFNQTLRWYFRDYLIDAPWKTEDKDVVGKLITLGREMGDKLLGEDHELMKVISILEADGIANLSVQIKSNRLEFFREQWEALILPESPYILSTACQAFERHYTTTETKSEAEKRYELNKDNPLHIIHLVPHHDLKDSTESTHLTLTANYVTGLQEYDGAVHYRSIPLTNWQEVSRQLRESPAHIVHYGGAIALDADKQPCFICGTEAISIKDFTKEIKNSHASVLLVESDSTDDAANITTETILASIATEALSEDIYGVVGLNQPTDPWTTQRCIMEIYHEVCKGHSFSQAIVEARKSLQRQTESDLFYPSPAPFHCWSLLRHYSQGSQLFFFSEPQQRVSLQETQQYSSIRQRMFGFAADLLPPEGYRTSDGILTTVLENSQTPQPIFITGENGCGKTLLLHQLAYFMTDHAALDHAFFFDIQEHDYSENDILGMIANVVAKTVATNQTDNSDQAEPADIHSTWDKLEKTHTLFVFDNLDDWKGNDDEFAHLNDFLNRLISQGQSVLMSGRQVPSTILTPLVFQVPALTTPEVKQIARQRLTTFDITDAEKNTGYENLLSLLKGNPLLIHNLIPALANHNSQELSNSLADHFQQHANCSAVIAAWHWQWSQLDELSQRWLETLSSTPGILLEMLSMVCDGNERPKTASELLRLFGHEDSKLSDCMRNMELYGFVISRSHGRMINPKALNFIKEQQQQDELFNTNGEHIKTLFSELTCMALSQLIMHTGRTPNPAISQYLLANRGIWAHHLEHLWLSEKYRPFLETLNQLSVLLQQNQLTPELAAWSSEVLGRTSLPSTALTDETAKMVAWLRLASTALSEPQAKDNQHLQHTAKTLHQWLNQHPIHIQEGQQPDPLAYNALGFLEEYYQVVQDWSSLYQIALRAEQEYSAFKMWPVLARIWFVLSDCAIRQDDHEQAVQYEQKILHDLPQDQLPPNYQTQLNMRILSRRTERADIRLAQELLNHMKNSDDGDRLAAVLDMMQADIFFQDGQYQMAARGYQTLISKGVLNNAEQQQYIHMKLEKCKEQLGETEFQFIVDDIEQQSQQATVH